MTTHTTENIPPDDVLSGALGKLRRVVVVGEELDGTYWFATSTGD